MELSLKKRYTSLYIFEVLYLIIFFLYYILSLNHWFIEVSFHPTIRLPVQVLLLTGYVAEILHINSTLLDGYNFSNSMVLEREQLFIYFTLQYLTRTFLLCSLLRNTYGEKDEYYEALFYSIFVILSLNSFTIAIIRFFCYFRAVINLKHSKIVFICSYLVENLFGRIEIGVGIIGVYTAFEYEIKFPLISEIEVLEPFSSEPLLQYFLHSYFILFVGFATLVAYYGMWTFGLEMRPKFKNKALGIRGVEQSGKAQDGKVLGNVQDLEKCHHEIIHI